MRWRMQPGVSRHHPKSKKELVPNDLYTCHLSHIVLINIVARYYNCYDAIRSQIEDLRSVSWGTFSKELEDSRRATHRISIVVFFEGRALGLLR